MRQATDAIEALRYKLRMFGIPIDGPCTVYGDNQSVITNASIPNSMLNKKHNSICYHRVRQAVAAQMIDVVKIDTRFNLADLLTKPLTADRREHLLQRILY
ncbi:hypothetical protein ACA910_015600 [Epithemia clementina (nom. ined.)]